MLATHTLSTCSSLEQRDAELASLQQKYETANAELERWRTAFKGPSVLPGLALGGAEADPTVVVQEVLKMGVQQSRLKEQVHAPSVLLCASQGPFSRLNLAVEFSLSCSRMIVWPVA